VDFLSDLFIAAGAFGAAVYCLVLSRRLKTLTALDSGMGNAIAILSAQVDELNTALTDARAVAQSSSGRLQAQTERADSAARRLELLIAALHDLPEQPGTAGQSDATGTSAEASDGAMAGRGARILRRRGTERAA